MNTDEKTVARILFKNKIYEADGQKFEDIFTAIMNYAEPDFQQIKPWGIIGDRKNDGYIKNKGIYYQVFAPEDIRKSYTDTINKLEHDFTGLLEQWSPVNEFYFVVNDKYKGVSPDCEKTIQEIKKIHKLQQAGFKTPKDLENILFDLRDDQIHIIVVFLPDPINIKSLDYSILNEIIEYIIELSLPSASDSEIIVPDWDEKIELNNLTTVPANYLNHGHFHIGSLDNYLKNNSSFLADEVKNKMRQLYFEEKNKGKDGDELFWRIVNRVSPKPEYIYQSAVIIIMAKYFEACDIFEDPS